MSAARVATYATTGAVLAWAVKAVVIGIAGGLGKSPAEGPLFFLGFVLFLTGIVAIGLAVGARRGTVGRLVGVVAAVAVTFVVWLVVDTAVAAAAPPDPHWAWAEAQLWIVSVAAAVGWRAWSDRGAEPAPAAA